MPRKTTLQGNGKPRGHHRHLSVRALARLIEDPEKVRARRKAREATTSETPTTVRETLKKSTTKVDMVRIHIYGSPGVRKRPILTVKEVHKDHAVACLNCGNKATNCASCDNRYTIPLRDMSVHSWSRRHDGIPMLDIGDRIETVIKNGLKLIPSSIRNETIFRFGLELDYQAARLD